MVGALPQWKPRRIIRDSTGIIRRVHPRFDHSPLTDSPITKVKIHEFQAKQILRDAGVAAPRGMVARTPEEAAKAYRELGSAIAVVKAQIHAGGRGKGT